MNTSVLLYGEPTSEEAVLCNYDNPGFVDQKKELLFKNADDEHVMNIR